MITRRRVLAGAGGAGALTLLPSGALPAGTAGRPRGACVGDVAVLRIVQGPPGTPPAGPGDAPLLWRLGAHEWLDQRRLCERLSGCPAARIEALVDDGNRLLLVDALRTRGGVLLREHYAPDTQRWNVVARAAAGDRVLGTEVHDDGIS
jgi:hypothetical protein